MQFLKRRPITNAQLQALYGIDGDPKVYPVQPGVAGQCLLAVFSERNDPERRVFIEQCSIEQSESGWELFAYFTVSQEASLLLFGEAPLP